MRILCALREGKVRASTYIWLSCWAWIIFFLFMQMWTAAVVVAIGGGIIFRLHVLEVKLNRLLEERGIYITDSEAED